MKITPQSRIGIIGGKGRTGRQFARLFRARGCPVTVTDEQTHSRNRTLFERCDIILFAVPLQESERIIRQEIVHATRKDQLIVDVSSLKEKQVKAMLRGKGDVIGMHPMFAPTSATTGQTIILCPARCAPQTLTSLRKILRVMGLRTIVMTATAHDHLMALVQALPHLKSLLIAEAMHRLNADLDAVDRSASPAYAQELDLVGRFLDDDPMLYGPIIFGNPQSRIIIRTLQTLLKECASICEKQDYRRFAKQYRTLQRRFGLARLTRARKRSEAGIRALTSSSHS